MKAVDVYNRNKRDIEIIVDAMRYEGKPGHIKGKDMDITSYQPFEHELEILSSPVVGGEIVGIHTTCQVMPIGEKDIKVICVQTDKQDVEKIKKCVSPIATDVILELADLSIDYERELIGLIPKVLRKEISVNEAHNILNTNWLKILEKRRKY